MLIGRLARLRDCEAPATLDDAVYVINQILMDDCGFSAEDSREQTPQAACVGEMLLRHSGHPAALAILYLQAARTLGVKGSAIDFPGHYLLRLDYAGTRTIVDPRAGGIQRNAANLRGLLKSVLGLDRELARAHYQPIDDCELLIRLQRERKALHLAARDNAGAARAIASLLRLAPEEHELIWEQAVYLIFSGDQTGGRACLERYLEGGQHQQNRAEALDLLRRLPTKSA